jgi:Domain of unknown function (DUF4185)
MGKILSSQKERAGTASPPRPSSLGLSVRQVILAASTLTAFVIGSASPQDILTLRPAYTEPSAVLVPMIEGTWLVDLSTRETIAFRKAGDNFYFLQLEEEGLASRFEAVFTNIGKELILDVLPVVPDAIGGPTFRKHLLQAHSLYRVTLTEDSLRISGLDYGWFHSHVLETAMNVPYTFSGTSPLLMMSTPDLREFIGRQAQEPGFFSGELLLSRIETARRPAESPGGKARRAEVLESLPGLEGCVPSFPLQEGWLGGDGDISIPLSAGRSIWIFSDTFVGRRAQTVSAGARMISSTVAISTCGPGREPTIEYFWRDRWTDMPRPIFESFTSRYKFWPCGAFVSDGRLYVPLLKIGPKPGAAPNDVFSFKGIGMSVARIGGYAETPPHEWSIEYIPWSQAFDPDAWGCCARSLDYVYVFERGKGDTAVLKRLHHDDLEEPESHVAWLSAAGTWRTDLPPSEAKVLFRGDVGNTVNYHQDLKMWVMVCGPGFMNNKIRIRSAPELTGPWSDEKVVYECPESTPGSAAYDKDNFCYLGREHIQFYDPATRMMLLTYDCNSVSFGKVVSNSKIYSPKMVRVRLDR